MKVLLDTHAFLWALMDPGQLGTKALEALQNPQTEVLVSAASAWEIAIKSRLGKLTGATAVIEDYAGALRGLQARELPISAQHALKAGGYAQTHRDPFDRILAAQAEIEGLTLISRDTALHAFALELLW